MIPRIFVVDSSSGISLDTRPFELMTFDLSSRSFFAPAQTRTKDTSDKRTADRRSWCARFRLPLAFFAFLKCFNSHRDLLRSCYFCHTAQEWTFDKWDEARQRWNPVVRGPVFATMQQARKRFLSVRNVQFCGYSALPTQSQLRRPCATIVHAKVSPSDLKGRCFYFVAPERLRSQGPDYRRQGRDPLTCCDPHTGARRSGPGCLPMTMHCKYAVTGADFCYRSYASMGHRGGRVGGVLWPAAFLNDALAMQLPLISTAMQCDCVVKISGTASIFFLFYFFLG